jgi:hypothetical protein
MRCSTKSIGSRVRSMFLSRIGGPKIISLRKVNLEMFFMDLELLDLS